MGLDGANVEHDVEQGSLSKRERWFLLIEEYERLGVKRKDFCASRGLNRDHFSYYYSQYRRCKSDKGKEGFVPVSILPSNDPWVVHCEPQLRVEVPWNVSVMTLLELLNGLRQLR